MKKILKMTGIALTIMVALIGMSIKNIENTEYGTLITFRDNTGYFIEKTNTNVKNIQTTPTGSLITYKDNTGYYMENQNNKIEVVSDVEYDGKRVIDFNNGSWAVINKKENKYTFQPVELGDWDYEFDNLKDFKDCIQMYTRDNLNEI